MIYIRFYLFTGLSPFPPFQIISIKFLAHEWINEVSIEHLICQALCSTFVSSVRQSLYGPWFHGTFSLVIDRYLRKYIHRIYIFKLS